MKCCLPSFFSKPAAPVAPIVPKESAIHKTKNRIETIFNALSMLPIVGMSVAPMRILGGTVQRWFGTAQGAVGVIGGAFSDKEQFKMLRKAGAENMLHGGLNTNRGSIDLSILELPLFAYTMTTYCEQFLIEEEAMSPNDEKLKTLADTIRTFTSAARGVAMSISLGLTITRLVKECFFRKEPFSPYIKNDANASIQEQLEQTKQLFSGWRWVPIAGNTSGLIRIQMGIEEAAYALAIGSIGLAGKTVSKREIFNEYTATGKKHVVNGLKGIGSGVIDLVASTVSSALLGAAVGLVAVATARSK